MSVGKQGEKGKTGAAGPRWRSEDIDKMDQKLDKLIGAIYEGNGQRSLMERTARIEENVEVMLEASAGRDACISTMSQCVSALTTSVDAHHKTFHLSSLLGNWKFYPVALACYLIAQNISNAIGRPVLAWLFELLKWPLPLWLT